MTGLVLFAGFLPPACISLVTAESKGDTKLETRGDKKDAVSDAEIEWMIKQRPLKADERQLLQDLGAAEGKEVTAAFSGSLEPFRAVLAWPGVSSRWKEFLGWLKSAEKSKEKLPATPRDALAGFAQHLGRVRSYRSLSLTEQQMQKIRDEDSIWPTGRLRADRDTVLKLVNKYGSRLVCTARLYIGLRLIGPIDPSLSLHDDAETSVCIAGGYLDPGRQIYCMEMDVPVIHTLGYTVGDVQSESSRHRWFSHRKIWFDASLQRTERYVFYEIPFFKANLRSVKVFSKQQEIEAFLAPFQARQLKLYKAWLAEQQKLGTGLSGDGSDVEEEEDGGDDDDADEAMTAAAGSGAGAAGSKKS